MSKVRYFILIFIGILTTTSSASSVFRKTFAASWNLGNKNNWKGKITPCPGRKVSILGSSDFQIFLDKDMAAASFICNQDTELIFGKSASLVFASESDGSCEGNDIEAEFKNKAPGYWWDPESWQCDINDILNCNSAVPDLHKVPCTRDTIFIPNVTNSLYKIFFTNPTPTVEFLLMGNKSMTTSDFYNFFTSDEGRQRIRSDEVSRSPLYVESEGPCTDVTGCQCHTVSPLNEICRHQSKKCPSPRCQNPVRMKGFCCLMCGIDISISHNGSLAISAVQTLLKRVLEIEGANVDAYVGKMYDSEFIHVYFMPKEESTSYDKAVDTFKTLFDREYNSLNQHAVFSAAAKGIFDSRKGSSKATLVVLIIICICSAIGILAYVYRKRRINDLPFMFRRMSSGRRISMRSRNTSIPSSIHIVAVETAEGRSFENPTFMSEPEIEFQTDERRTSLITVQSFLPDDAEVTNIQHERENPLYSIQKDTSISFNALKQKSSAPTENLIASTSDVKIESKKASNEEVVETHSEIPMVKEEMIIDVSVSDEEEDPFSLDDEMDPLELLAKSRLGNIIQLQSKIDEDFPNNDKEVSKSGENSNVDDDLFSPVMLDTRKEDVTEDPNISEMLMEKISEKNT